MDYKYIEIPNKKILPEQSVTVIVPTMFKGDKELFTRTLDYLKQCPAVKYIILINNTDNPLPSSGKLKVISEGDFSVNPAWNRGLKECDTPYFLLLNDDVLCHGNVIEECISVMEYNSFYDILFVETQRGPVEDYQINVATKNSIVIGMIQKELTMSMLSGCFIFGRKSVWVDIPSDLKIFFGDNWILDHNKETVMKIVSNYVIHKEATTVRALNKYSDGTFEQEKKIYDTYENKP